MNIFFIKSLLAIAVVLSALVAMYTMFEVFGREEKRHDIDKLKRVHRINGIVFILFYLVIAYFCLDYLLRTKAEPTPRAALHGVFAVSVITLLALKIFIVRVYRGFYNQAKTLGLLVALLTFGMVATSAGYYLLITKLGTERQIEKITEVPKGGKWVVRTDQGSVEAGKELYMSKCFLCHDPYSNETVVGPGHKGILKNPRLPVSGKPATPENVVHQLREPFKKMPNFGYLTVEEIEDLLAFLGTL
jgi:hypothetical protein